jgi:hypothetical protein
MSPLWALSVILIILTIIFVVLPNMHEKRSATVHVVPRVQAPIVTPEAAQAAAAVEKEKCMDREMLKSFYPPPLKENTPIDYPRKAIGACPYSKPQSRPLPPVDIPMYLIV